jgi:hypothetical protein
VRKVVDVLKNSSEADRAGFLRNVGDLSKLGWKILGDFGHTFLLEKNVLMHLHIYVNIFYIYVNIKYIYKF